MTGTYSLFFKMTQNITFGLYNRFLRTGDVQEHTEIISVHQLYKGIETIKLFRYEINL